MPELILQCDERWSFVGHKGCKYWGWIALDAATGRIVALYAGDRSQASARGLWEKLPPAYRDHAIFYTDFRESYTAVIPTARHHRVGKDEVGTQKIERFNNTLRQRCSRLVRQCLSFSK